MMAQQMKIRDVFRLSDGTTVLACEGAVSGKLEGRGAALVADGQVRQNIVLSGERTMRHPTQHVEQRAFETLDQVELLAEDVRIGNWTLVLE
jgi:hypothetical protein